VTELLIVAAYDIAISSPGGTKRLAQVAKLCERYGQRVQNSVFECVIDTMQFKQLQNEMLAIIHQDVDSVRYYNLGNHYESKVIHVGAKDVQNIESPIIL